MDRETKVITTPHSNIPVVVYTYITGREKRQLLNVYLNGGNIGFDPDEKKVTGLRGELVQQSTDLAWRTLIVSFNGNKDGDVLADGTKFDVVEAILDLRSQDYNFIVEEINKLTSDDDFEKKKMN